MSIDVAYDFTRDTRNYWEDFWGNNNGLGAGRNDPDTKSITLQQYHRELWSRQLPNGEIMDLAIGSGADYLTWKGFRFGSDSITASFRYNRQRFMIEQLEKSLDDYRHYMEDFIRRSYTMGGTIIFPKRQGGINQARGTRKSISDRWDLTLECIRRYYNHEPSPLYETLQADRAFFDLFVDFRGYVDFFFLQDCVSPDYTSVIFWIGNGDFTQNPLPKTTGEYQIWIKRQLEFVERRNARISASFPGQDGLPGQRHHF
jgi:hypothetical protein